MAILALFTGNNLTKQMYESLLKEVDWVHNHPPGGIFHAAAFDDSGPQVEIFQIHNVNAFSGIEKYRTE